MGDDVQHTYDRLVRSRNSQLKYMSGVRSKEEEIGFVITSDLVFYHNHVHQLIDSFAPTNNDGSSDPCFLDGGVVCSNLAVLNDLLNVGDRRTVVPTDGTDYLTSRIIHLLGMPIPTNDQKFTVRVPDAFTANVRALYLAFEERYGLCRERNERLTNELAAIRRQLLAVGPLPAVKSQAVVGNDNERAIRVLRDRVARYETLSALARERIEDLRRSDEQSAKRNRHECRLLMRRLDRSSRNGLAEVVRDLLKDQTAERQRLDDAIGQIDRSFRQCTLESVNPQSGRDVSDRRPVRKATKATRTTDEKRFGRIVKARLRDGLASQMRHLECLAEREIVARSSREEHELRAKLEAELNGRKEELRHRFDEEINAEIARTNVKPLVPSASELWWQRPRNVSENDATRLETIKLALDACFAVTPSDDGECPIPIVPPTERRRELNLEFQIYGPRMLETIADRRARADSNADSDAIRDVFDYTRRLLKTMRDTYGLLVERSSLLVDINVISTRDYVPLRSMTEDRTVIFVREAERIIAARTKRVDNGETPVFKLLDDILVVTARMKSEFIDFYRTWRQVRRVQSNHGLYDVPGLNEIRKEAEGLEKAFRRYDWTPLTDDERRRLDELRRSKDEARATIVKHFQSARNHDERLGLLGGAALVDYRVLNAEQKLESFERADAALKFRSLYNELALFAIELGDAFKRIFRDVSAAACPPPPVLRHHLRSLNELFDKSDRAVAFGCSPRPVKDLVDIIPGLELIGELTRSEENCDSSGPAASTGRSAPNRVHLYVTA